MDMNEIMKATEEKAVELKKALHGRKGFDVDVMILNGCYGRICPAIEVTCRGKHCFDAIDIIRGEAHLLDGWVEPNKQRGFLPNVWSMTLVPTLAYALYRAKSAIKAEIFCVALAADKIAHTFGAAIASQAIAKCLAGSDERQAIADYLANVENFSSLDAAAEKCAMRLFAAGTVHQLAAIERMMLEEMAALKVALTAQAAAQAKASAEAEAVEIAETATYSVDGGVEHMITAHVGGVDVGGASVIVYDNGDAYIERVDIDGGHRNRGYGTAMLKQLAAMYGDVYLAPDNDDARRLYARLGDDVTSKGSWGYVDQGFGVYAIAA